METPAALHAYESDGDGSCLTCRLPVGSRFHLSVVDQAG